MVEFNGGTKTKPITTLSYNEGFLALAASQFFRCTEKPGREKWLLGRFLAEQLPLLRLAEGARIADIGAGSGAVTENLLTRAQELQEQRHIQQLPAGLVILEPTDILLHQAQSRLHPWNTPTLYIHDSFQKGMDQIPDMSLDLVFEVQASSNFGNMQEAVETLTRKVAPGGKVISILSSHKANDYADFNLWARPLVCEATRWDKEATNDNAVSIRGAADKFMQENNNQNTWKVKTDMITTQFFYPIHRNIQKSIAYMLIFLFDIKQLNPLHPQEEFLSLLQQTEQYLREKGMIHEDTKEIVMGLDLQVLTLERESAQSLRR